MKKSFKRLKLLSLFLLCPFLTAFTKLNKCSSDDGYRDFTITYKQESYHNHSNAYVLDVVNNGNQYIKRDYIYMRILLTVKLKFWYITKAFQKILEMGIVLF